MEHFFDWFTRRVTPGEPWLILGKGPTFEHRDRFDLRRYHLLSLNHALREQPVLVAHMIDLDVVQACEDVLEARAEVVVLPWYPHVQNKVGSSPLDEVVAHSPVLQRLIRDGRLLWYDLSTSPRRHGPGPVVEATFFSAEAAVSLLAHAGVAELRSLGVDGGVTYSRKFRDLDRRTLLSNGQPSFDAQFQGIARTLLRTRMSFVPLTIPTPARVYVAATSADALPLAVLEFSIRSRASLSLGFVRAGDQSSDAQVPSEGLGIILPTRSLCLLDLRHLATVEVEPEGIVVFEDGDFPGPAAALVGGSVSALDRVRLAWLLRSNPSVEEVSRAYPHRVRAEGLPSMPSIPFEVPPALPRYSEGQAPWVSRVHPQGHIWMRELLRAVDEGHVTAAQVAAEVACGHLRPSLSHQLRQGQEEALLLSPSASRSDRGFRAPGGALVAGGPRIMHPLRTGRALARTMRVAVRRWRAGTPAEARAT